MLLGAAAPKVDPAIAGWAYIVARTPPPPGGWNATAPRTLPGSTATFTDAQLHDLSRAVDWFPKRHAQLPPAVAGKGDIPACGSCHLPGGEGRVENASLAGLPTAYIREQVAAFAAGTRTSAVPGYVPTAFMATVAHQVAPAEIAAAARYFTRQRYTTHIRVVEAATVPAMTAHDFILSRAPGGGSEAIAGRIVETPDDIDAFEKHDPRGTFTAYVPPGSLVAGAAVAERVGCVTCHGAGMKLWGAGRSPTYIFRQLLAFKTGARHDAEAAPMTAVAEQLSPADMVAVAAYWGSLKP
ncbi:MAG: c-type cytochrome [Janthinobacterium lividum]